MIPEADRLRFLSAELRYLRYENLSLVKVWEGDIRNYWQQVEQWRESKEALVVTAQPPDWDRTHPGEEFRWSAKAGELLGMELGPGPAMPPCPSYLPAEQDLHDIVVRARRSNCHAFRRVAQVGRQ